MKKLITVSKSVFALSVLIPAMIFLPVRMPAQALGPQPTAYHTIALHSDGTVYTWGENVSGQLGDDNYPYRSYTPVKVKSGEYSDNYTYLGDSTGNKIIAVSAGYGHSIALAEDGIVYTWGDNVYGQLGDDNYPNDSDVPVKVHAGAYSSDGTYSYLGEDPNNKVIAVAAGDGYSIAVTEDGIVYTWGFNYYGQLGDNTTTDKHTPVKVLAGEYSGTDYLGDDSNNKITAIATGRYFSAALAADGTVYTWGNNSVGQLGNGTTTNSLTPVKVHAGDYSPDGTYTYLGEDSNNKINAIAFGEVHSAALAEDGMVYTWGYNSDGQLGDGSTTNSSTPVKVHAGEYSGTTYLGDDVNNKITAIALGYSNSSALAADGLVYTWGKNNNGQLGNGTAGSLTDKSTPVKVHDGEYSGTTYLGDDVNNKITAIALGYDYSIALATDGTVYTWGYNYYGQLGDGTTTDKHVPVKVSGEGGNGDLSLPVEIASFTATAGNGRITLTWTTESEIDNLGFNIYRSRKPDGQFTKINDRLIRGAGSSSNRHEYDYTDIDVINGINYWYKLEDVDYRGNTALHGLVSATPVKSGAPGEYCLHPNYPNPFNPVTRIAYDLPEEGNVRLAVYDLSGREIKTLLSGRQESGSYQITWDGTDQNGELVSSGVYFLSITSGSYSKTHKMVFVR